MNNDIINLKAKIKKFDFEFTEEEKDLIFRNEEISYLIIKTLMDNPEYIKNVWNVTINESAYDLLSESEKIKFVEINIIYELHDCNRFKVDDIIEYINYLKISNADAVLEEIITKIMSDASLKFSENDDNASIDYKALEYLLNYKRYDLIEKCTYIIGDDDDYARKIVDRFFIEYPFDKYKRPYMIHGIGGLTDNKNLSISEMIEYFNSIAPSPRFGSSADVDRASVESEIQEIIKKINDADTLEDLSDEIHWHKLIKYLTAEEKEAIFDTCLNKGYYLNSSFCSIYLSNKKDIEDLKIKLHNDIMNNKKIHIPLLKYLLNNGFQINEEDAKVIVKNINDNNPRYDEFIRYIDYDLANLPEIVVKAIINKGKIRKLSSFSYDKNSEYYKLFLMLLNKYPDVNFDTDIIKTINVDIINILLNKKAYYLIISLLNRNPEGINLEVISLLKSKIKEDKSFAEMFLNFHNIMDYNDLVDIYLENKESFNLIMNHVIHNNDNLSYLKFYSNENYQKVKHFFEGLNLEHLDILERLYGPTIMDYINSDNFQKVINLDDETFNKLINLFKENDFTMVDIEASYEAIIQQVFSLEKSDVIDLFTYYKNAMQDGNIQQIRKYNEILMNKLDNKIINKVVNKFNLECDSLSGLFELINNYYHIVEKRQEALDILKEVTDYYKFLEYKDYRNNYHFNRVHPELKNLYETIVELLLNNQVKYTHKYSMMMIDALDEGVFRALKEYPYFNTLRVYNNNCFDLVNRLFKNIANNYNREQNLELLKVVVNYYKEKVKKEFLKHSCIGEDLELPYSLDIKNSESYFLEFLVKNMNSFYIDKDHTILLRTKVFEELKKMDLSDSMINGLFLYYFNKNASLTNPINEVQRNMKKFIVTSYQIVKNNVLYNKYGYEVNGEKDSIISQADEKHKIKRIYEIDYSDIDVFKILSEINVSQIQKLFSDEKKYEILLKIMERRKLHLIPNSILKMLSRDGINIEFNENYAAAFINYFDDIYNQTVRMLLSARGSYTDEDLILGFITVMQYSKVFGEMSNVYSQILGFEDAKLIELNPKENSNNMPAKDRLEKAVEITPKIFRRTSVTIPTFSENIVFNNGIDNKNIDVIVGNFTDPSNLTHGERTGACMRIGGVGSGLFDFCLLNENGFHIRFEDPSTHSYISRVSGFRNGNTVFLNELRCSKEPKLYSDYDLECALEQVAKKIISMSRDSNYPIDNVVVHRAYATMNSPKKEVDLQVQNVKEGFDNFWTDVNSFTLLLASSKDGGFVPVNFDKKNLPHYPVSRSRIIVSNILTDVSGKINRVSSVKKLLEGEEYEYIEPIVFENGLIYAAVSDDWYVYVDEKMEIHSEVIDIDPRAIEEMQECMAYANNLVEGKEMSL